MFYGYINASTLQKHAEKKSGAQDVAPLNWFAIYHFGQMAKSIYFKNHESQIIVLGCASGEINHLAVNRINQTLGIHF